MLGHPSMLPGSSLAQKRCGAGFLQAHCNLSSPAPDASTPLLAIISYPAGPYVSSQGGSRLHALEPEHLHGCRKGLPLPQ
eukprot:624859-Pelagomonas_calceolata.AAC.2